MQLDLANEQMNKLQGENECLKKTRDVDGSETRSLRAKINELERYEGSCDVDCDDDVVMLFLIPGIEFAERFLK